ncbi:cation transport protein-domain-containing protein [Aspergillus ambiguus]|uniref:putative potassium uptake transporter n=1 Tax=Aspergillus ambiguus TaxID=176160 RepID=UPI003CCE1D9F
MWPKPQLNFITLHYAYIILLGLLSLPILYPYGNLRAIDAYFFGVSASTESGLNTIDVKELKLYQQLFIYFVPIVSNLGFINIIVVCVRLWWFRKRLDEIGLANLNKKLVSRDKGDIENGLQHSPKQLVEGCNPDHQEHHLQYDDNKPAAEPTNAVPAFKDEQETESPPPPGDSNSRSISFANTDKALYIPSPQERDRGHPIIEVDRDTIADDPGRSETPHPRLRRSVSARNDTALERVASSMFVLGKQRSRSHGPRMSQAISLSKDSNLPGLSSQATLGRNSQFHNLTAEDREKLGGIEYLSLKLLLKIVLGYFFGLHLLGIICLVGWIQYAPSKYRDYIASCGINPIWWAFYSGQTMVDNLGFTLTPDSMVSFNDATFPMLVLTFLAFVGNTLYPCFLRLIIWILFICVPRNSSLREQLDFLLKYPRRCYMLLFRSRPTWVLFGIIFALNFVDVLLIITLDLDNPTVNELPLGPRILAALFQAASSRHTGTATFNLADVNPAVQFSLLVMMYISIFPIAISVRASNTYEERALGVYESDGDLDENNGAKYVLAHMRNQLSFDLWYIFIGLFCIIATESKRIMDPSEPGFNVFAIFFETVSAYANVGLSLGYPTVMTSLSGQFSTFSKVVICAMMIRGRHRGLPYQIDRAILLPGERLVEDDQMSDARPAPWHATDRVTWMDGRQPKVKRYYTK